MKDIEDIRVYRMYKMYTFVFMQSHMHIQLVSTI